MVFLQGFHLNNTASPADILNFLYVRNCKVILQTKFMTSRKYFDFSNLSRSSFFFTIDINICPRRRNSNCHQSKFLGFGIASRLLRSIANGYFFFFCLLTILGSKTCLLFFCISITISLARISYRPPHLEIYLSKYLICSVQTILMCILRRR